MTHPATVGPGYAYGALHAAEGDLTELNPDDPDPHRLQSAHQSVNEAIRALDEWDPQPRTAEPPVFGYLYGVLRDLFLLALIAMAVFYILDALDLDGNP